MFYFGLKNVFSFLKFRGFKQSGFTLIELMIVVGIIGVLVSLTGPQYRKYRNRARQSEAKLAMGAIFTLEKSFYAEYAAYSPAFDAIGYAPEGNRRFYWLGLTNDGVLSATITGYAGAQTVANFNFLNTPYSPTYSFSPPAGCATIGGASYGSDPQIFFAYAHGNLGVATDDIWSINQLKVLANCSIGI